MMRAVRQLALLAGLALAGFAIYVLLFWAGAAASIGILFYRGIVLAFAVAILVALAAFFLIRRSSDSSLPIAAAALSLSFNICFLVLLPVTVDRSISVYLLSTIERQQQKGVDAPGLERSFVADYVTGMGAIDRRLDEQKRSGNVTVGSDGKVRLTPQGRRFMALSRVIARLFGADPRIVGQAPAQRRH
ncbi:MAG TPA: hypothetical protein VFW35_02780 [Sphingomicrobium sp.]|nr:hypothetical protein [Sphingomicrobium sp.]